MSNEALLSLFLILGNRVATFYISKQVEIKQP